MLIPAESSDYNNFIEGASTIKTKNNETAIFCRYFIQSFKKLYHLDKEKHMEPKFSETLRPLANTIIQNKYDLIHGDFKSQNGAHARSNIRNGSVNSDFSDLTE